MEIPKKKRKFNQRSMIINAIRQVWLRSPQRGAAMKLYGYKCEKCGVKQSASKLHPQKIQVHHRNPIDKAWDEIVNIFLEKILVTPDKLECICPACHKAEHKRLKTIHEK